ncbi:MerR family transcriptional regulator [Rhodococcus sp. NPDC056743]|uniref:MerR family transcriptional regulator n=1 Tax=Rhodococcus sp. NPDC056743 TaxID=3345934 RepID=UPI003672A7D4
MRIGQLAEAAQTTPRTVRHYHRLGLLAEPVRRANGYREYTMDDVVRLVRIRWLAERGVPLGSIAALFSADTSEEGVSDTVADLRALIGAVEVEQVKLARRHAGLTSMLADAESGRIVSALPAEVASALTEAVDTASSPGVRRALERERDLLEVLAMTGSAPEQFLRSYAVVIADDHKRARYVALLSEWSSIEGKEPVSVESTIERLSCSILAQFDEQAIADLRAQSAEFGPGLPISLDDVVPDPAQREVVLRVQCALVARMASEGDGR